METPEPATPEYVNKHIVVFYFILAVAVLAYNSSPFVEAVDSFAEAIGVRRAFSRHFTTLMSLGLPEKPARQINSYLAFTYTISLVYLVYRFSLQIKYRDTRYRRKTLEVMALFSLILFAAFYFVGDFTASKGVYSISLHHPITVSIFLLAFLFASVCVIAAEFLVQATAARQRRP